MATWQQEINSHSASGETSERDGDLAARHWFQSAGGETIERDGEWEWEVPACMQESVKG